MSATRSRLCAGVLLVSAWLLVQPVRAQQPDVSTQADSNALINELQGQTAPATRTAGQWQQAYARALEALLPDMSSEDYSKRGLAQQRWENISLRSARPGSQQERQAAVRAMVARLTGATPLEARIWLLRMLEHIGSAESAGPVAALLRDGEAELRERARRALANNPAPEAGAALRAALAGSTGADRIALVNALAYRRDAASVATIAVLARNTDERLATAAVAALGRIGGGEALDALRELNTAASATLRRRAVDARLSAADQLLAGGSKQQAGAVYQELFAPAQPPAVRIAALRGLLASRGAEAGPVLLDVLRGQDPQFRSVASAYVEESRGVDSTRAFASLLPQLPPHGQSALLVSLGRRADTTARGAVLPLLKSAAPEVRAAALESLGRLGNSQDVALLAEAAASADGPQAEAARSSLATLSGADVNEVMLRALQGAGPAVRVQLMRGLAARRATGAVPALLTALSNNNAAVRNEAVSALGVLGGEQSLPALVALLVKSPDDATRQTLELAMTAVINRLPDKTRAAEPMVAGLAGADVASRRSLLAMLQNAGGARALQAVLAATADTNPQVQDAATRSLAGWTEAAAAPDLLRIAGSAANQAHQVLALQGYIRLAGAGERPAAERVRMYQDAVRAARRPDEKRRALAGLAAVSHPDALTTAMSHLGDETLREEAAAAAVAIAKGLGGAAGDVKPHMRRVIEVTKVADTSRQAAEVMSLADVVLRGWHILGPYPNEFDKLQEPEQTVDFNKTYTVRPGQTARWKPAVTQPTGLVDLEAQLQPNQNAAAYASVYVKSPDARRATVSLGSDDGARLWVNGKLIISSNVNRAATPGEDKAPVDLKAGWNHVLLKVMQSGGGWGYYFDIIDAAGKPMTDLVYASKPEG